VYNFLSPDESKAIIKEATERGLDRSTVLSENSPVQSSRTSRHTFLDPGTSPAAATIMQRASALLGIPLSHFEQLQVAAYEKGQEYRAHNDACKQCTASKQDLARMYTLLVYLNDDFEGGHTVFPNCGVDVKPRQGMGVLWRNIDDNGTNLKSSFHAGESVTGRGTKWICTMWIHGTPYRPS
jgi:prolyl 4-hydroxylase